MDRLGIEVARWENWEIERYRAQCRAKPVPQDTLAWWNRAVGQERARLDEERRLARD